MFFFVFWQAVFTHSGRHLPITLLSYCIVLFPSADVITGYPLLNHVISNNLYSLITGQDSSKKPKYRFDWLLKVLLRLVTALLPILAAFGVANLIYIFRYAGLFGFMNLFFPILLQLRSSYVCEMTFSPPEDSPSLSSDPSGSDEERSSSQDSDRSGTPLCCAKSRKISSSGSHLNHCLSNSKSRQEANGHSCMAVNKSDRLSEESSDSEDEKALLKEKQNKKGAKASYMTPYSFVVLSHPAFVCVVGIFGVLLLLLALAGLFVQLQKLTCEMYI